MAGDPCARPRARPAGIRRAAWYGTLPACVLLIACGSRSALPSCDRPGSSRPCESACGTGTQTCASGQWQACEVPVTSRACSNDCGSGEQSCAHGAWASCAVPRASRRCQTQCGQGMQTCIDGAWGACDAPQPGPPTYAATIWNFTTAHPDFGSDGGIGLDPGIVATDLGTDDKPVYASDASTPTTHGAFYFDEWYRDTSRANPGFDAGPVNETTSISLALTPWANDPTIVTYDNDFFFPVDGKLFGNEGPHNYYFTLALAATFRYTGGETFRFESDDDSWVFLNRRLAVDLGGVHPATARSVSLDLVSQELGLVKGQTYPMHLFFADRRVVNSVLHIDVPAADFDVCDGGAMP